MADFILDDTTIEKRDFTKTPFQKGEYNNCSFISCNFSQSDLSNCLFIDCTFKDCEFSLANIYNTAFQNITFTNCKLMGLHFEDCNRFLLKMNFSHTILNLASFYKLQIKETLFEHCDIQEADFTETDLQNAVFDNCNLDKTVFNNTNLQKANFLTAYNYIIDPEQNNLKKAQFSLHGCAGLLYKYDISIQ